MVFKIVIALFIVATVVVVNANVIAEKHPLTSADVESLLDPIVHGLEENQHKLVYSGPDGKDACLVCQPFQGCGCTDIVGIRCELKRLRKVMHRMKAIVDPIPPHVPGDENDE